MKILNTVILLSCKQFRKYSNQNKLLVGTAYIVKNSIFEVYSGHLEIQLF